MTKKKLLLIGYNFHPEPTGIGKYSGEMMDWLAAQGHACTVLTAYPYYPHWRVQEPYHARRFGYLTERRAYPATGGSLTVLRCPMYVPARPTGLRRILADFSFLLSAGLRLLGGAGRPDAVLVVAPSFLLGLLGVLVKATTGARLVYHIQDLQIEAARDLGMIKNQQLINALFGVERFIFRRADVVSSISVGMSARLAAKVGREVVLFPNWADTDHFRPLPDRPALKAAYGFGAAEPVVLYSGAIGEKQGLEAILQAAQALPELRFVICGSGPYRATLEALAGQLTLGNLTFLPLQPAGQLNEFLNMADVHLVIQKANASDLVMPSKLTTILAVGGLAVITANPDSGLHQLVARHEMGLLVAAESQAALEAGIARAVREDGRRLRANARAYALAHLSREGVMREFERAALAG